MKSIFKFDIDLIIDEYSNYVYKIINNIVGKSLPYENKEEIASDTFYLLWKNGTNIKTNLKAYLATIARNCSYEKLNCLNNEEKKIFGFFYLEGLKIKEITKEKIAYVNFEREEKMRKNKIAKIITFIFILGMFVCGTFTVNALTDNAIVNSVKDVLKIKVNDKEYNSNCVDDGNRMITCNNSKEVTGNDAEASITISKDYIDKVEAEYTDEGMSITING